MDQEHKQTSELVDVGTGKELFVREDPNDVVAISLADPMFEPESSGVLREPKDPG